MVRNEIFLIYVPSYVCYIRFVLFGAHEMFESTVEIWLPLCNLIKRKTVKAFWPPRAINLNNPPETLIALLMLEFCLSLKKVMSKSLHT